MSESVAPQTEPGHYQNLIDRAVACIDGHGGKIDDARLVAHVFGVSGSRKLWAPLLNEILQQDARVSRLPNGWWSTQPAIQHGDLPADFVVLDVETTGLKPRQHRMIEIALIRFSRDAEPLVWSTLLNPGRRIPDYVRTLTRIDDSMVTNAPEFRSVAPTVVEIIGDLPIVGHNVPFDISFLNAELVRAGLGRCINVAIDTLTIADHFLPKARRLGLQDVARELGIERKQHHRALSDAEITSDVFRSLMGIAAEQGISSFQAILEISSRSRKRRSSGRPLGRGRSLLDAEILKEIPHAPGVYIMRDSGDRVIYVGKAKDLRKRVGSYYSQPLGYTRKMDGLLETLERIDVEVVGTELEALLLESQLIRRYRPRFNTVQRNAEQYAYIKVDVTNRWPTVTMTKDRHRDDARYFGPFRSPNSARDAVQLINATLPLRTCKRSFRNTRSLGSPCIELSLGRCAGPCMGLADPETYRDHVNLVLQFLEGDERALYPWLHSRLEAAAESLDFEKASRLRDQITKANRLALEQAEIGKWVDQPHVVLVLPGKGDGCRDLWYLHRGRKWATFSIAVGEDLVSLAERVERSRQRAISAGDVLVDDHYSVDETVILTRWLNRNTEYPGILVWDDNLTAPEIVATAMAVDLEARIDSTPEPVE